LCQEGKIGAPIHHHVALLLHFEGDKGGNQGKKQMQRKRDLQREKKGAHPGGNGNSKRRGRQMDTQLRKTRNEPVCGEKKNEKEERDTRETTPERGRGITRSSLTDITCHQGVKDVLGQKKPKTFLLNSQGGG